MLIDEPSVKPSGHRWSTPGQPGPDREAEADLIELLEDHGPREGHMMAAYEELIEASSVPAVQYLGRLILEDERRHHRIIDEMLNQVRSVVWEVDVEPSTPSMPAHTDAELLDETQRLLAFERDDAKQLRLLRKALHGTERSSLLPLLVELLIHDTAKHIEILKFIKAHAHR